ncbi:MAG: hypothetical protein IJ662_01440 [Clostridia bacterium]|nr:hypothetical protein [Clostridia bacterium]
MNGNRGQYTSAPLANMKKRRAAPQPVLTPQADPNQPSAQQPKEKRHLMLSLIVCLGLPILFLAALIIPNNILRYVFLGAVVISVLAMWIMNAFAKSARGTLSVIYAALAVVIGLALFMNSQTPETRNASAPQGDGGSAFANNNPMAFGAVLANINTPAPETNANSAAAAAAVSAAQQQLEGFLSAWAVGNVPEMLEYVQPAWKTQQTSPETSLWLLTQDSRPTSYEIESVQGSDGDTTRVIVIRVTLNERNAGSEPVLKRMQVLLSRSGQTWYVDPNSLNGVIIDQAAEEAKKNQPAIATTIAPSPTPAPDTGASGITLYYNPNGGKYYHSTATCEAVDQQYWPLTGKFTYEELNSATYSKLIACPKCNPPARVSGR